MYWRKMLTALVQPTESIVNARTLARPRMHYGTWGPFSILLASLMQKFNRDSLQGVAAGQPWEDIGLLEAPFVLKPCCSRSTSSLPLLEHSKEFVFTSSDFDRLDRQLCIYGRKAWGRRA